MKQLNFINYKIAIIIPYYNASKQILRVISKIPDYIHSVIIIDDMGPEPLPKTEIQNTINKSTTIVFLANEKNLGVGGATKHGFSSAIEHQYDIVIKVDADDQMDLNYIPQLLEPIITGKCDMAKGNRFRDFKALNNMPLVRRLGNLVLSFLIKLATGYWNNFDPTNGFFAIKVDSLKNLNLNKLANRYYFETSLLAELHTFDTKIADIPMPAIYGDEKSGMKLWKMPFLFGAKLPITLFKRIIKEYFLYDFNIGSIYIFFGFPLFLFGIIFGGITWREASITKELVHTGTIMIVTLSLILGFQLVLQAIQYDIIKAPNSKN